MNKEQKRLTATKYLVQKLLDKFNLDTDVLEDNNWKDYLYLTEEQSIEFMRFAMRHYKKVLNLSHIRARAYSMGFWDKFGVKVIPKTKIIAIVGHSGSGKTYVADWIDVEWWIPMLQSYTTRKPRYKGEKSHKFITESQFNKINKADMVAYTCWDGIHYFTLNKDMCGLNTYVIDPVGYKMLLADKNIDVVSIFIDSDKKKRIEKVGKERVDRDEGKFDDMEYDYIVKNNYDDSIVLEIDKIIRKELP